MLTNYWANPLNHRIILSCKIYDDLKKEKELKELLDFGAQCFLLLLLNSVERLNLKNKITTLS